MVNAKAKSCKRDRKDQVTTSWCGPCRGKKANVACKWKAPLATVALAAGRYDDSERVRLALQTVTKPKPKKIRGLQALRDFKNGMYYPDF
jgi:hypothetical protein